METAAGPRIVIVVVAACLLVGVRGVPAFAPCHIGSFVGVPYRVGENESSVAITYSNNSAPGPQPGGSVDYRTVDGTAKSGKDYASTSGTLTWGSLPAAAAAGAINPAYRSFSVQILQNTIDEPEEMFTIQMSNFKGCFDAGPSDKTATVTIIDDDEPVAAQSTSAAKPKISAQSPPAGTDQTSTPTQTSSPQQNVGPSPSPTETETFVSAAGSRGTDEALSGGALAGIVVGALALGSIGFFLVRRRFLT